MLALQTYAIASGLCGVRLNQGFMHARPTPYQLGHSSIQCYYSLETHSLLLSSQGPSGWQDPWGPEKLRIQSELRLSEAEHMPKSLASEVRPVYWVIRSHVARADTHKGQKACGGHPLFLTTPLVGSPRARKWQPSLCYSALEPLLTPESLPNLTHLTTLRLTLTSDFCHSPV